MILDDIITKTKERVTEQKKLMNIDYLERAMSSGYEPRDPFEVLGGTMNIIPEIKKASPNRGVIKYDFRPLELAAEFEKNGASAISVLTEPYYFGGDIEFLGLIRRFNGSILFRRDFIIDPYQIARSRLYGADIVLLIAKILGQQQLNELVSYAKSIKMNVLVEVHNEEEVGKALQSGARIIGINNRNLDALTLDLNISRRLAPQIPKDRIVIAQSGFSKREELLELSQLGVNAFLIGEYLMRQENPGLALKELKYGK